MEPEGEQATERSAYEHPVVERRADGVLQLRFENERGEVLEVNAALLADTLKGMSELSGIAASADVYGTVVAPELKVRPPREGSFEIDFVLWTQENAATMDAMAKLGTTVAGVTGGLVGIGSSAAMLGKFIRWAKKLTTVTVESTEELDGGTTRVTWSNGGVDDFPTPVVRRLMQQTGQAKTRSALRKLTAPLGDDASSLEVREGTAEQSPREIEAAEPEVVLTEHDHAAFSQDPPASPVTTREFETEGRLEALNFKDRGKWRIATPDEPRGRSVVVLDAAFLAAIAAGESVSADDVFWFRIRETVDPSKKSHRTTWELLKVVSHRRGVFDGGDTAGGATSAN